LKPIILESIIKINESLGVLHAAGFRGKGNNDVIAGPADRRQKTMNIEGRHNLQGHNEMKEGFKSAMELHRLVINQNPIFITQ